MNNTLRASLATRADALYMSDAVLDARCCRAVARAIALCALLAGASTAQAQTTLAVDYGHDARLQRVGVGAWIPSGYASRLGPGTLALNWEADVGVFRANIKDGERRYLADIGFTPALRYTLERMEDVRPYADIGVGAHVLSAHDIADRRLGTNFQFGDFIGGGVQFGERHEFALAFRVLHESNAGIRKPNNGLTVWGARFEYALP